MLIEKHQVVSLHYKLTEDTASGELIEETYGAEPLTFIYGIGMMLPAFENHLESKVAGDGFAFTLEPGDAYGEYEEQAVVEIPISSFADAEGNIDREHHSQCMIMREGHIMVLLQNQKSSQL